MRLTLPVSLYFALLNLTFAAIAAPVNYAGMSLGFEPNAGQGKAGFQFTARGFGYRLDLARTGSQIALRNDRGTAKLTWSLIGANPSAKWEPLDRLAKISSYFNGRDPRAWKANIENFARLREVAIYPGIDLIYTGNQRQLEYDFVIAPGADPNVIHLRFAGAEAIHLDESGNLILETQAGELVQRRPVLYQATRSGRRDITGGFVIDRDGDVSFRIGKYDRATPLIIDPTLEYSTFLGGAGADQGNAIAVDQAGNFYVTGVTFSTKNADGDVLVRKFSPNGLEVYNADLGGSRNDYGYGIQVDGTGSVYIGGYTNSSDFPLSHPVQTTLAGSYNPFILRLDSTGQKLIFSTYFGGDDDDECRAIALDKHGNIYLTGFSSSNSFPITTNSYQPVNAGGFDTFAVKFDAQGRLLYSTLIGGNVDDQGYGIAVDENGDAYITGYSESDTFPQAGNPLSNARHGGKDVFLTEVNSTGTGLLYSTLFGGSADDYGYGIALDAAGAAYITGKTGSPDFPTTTGAYSTTYAGGTFDIFVTKIITGRAGPVYSTYLGGPGDDEGRAIAIDAAGASYITGGTDSDQFPITPDAAQPKHAGKKDGFLTKLNGMGTTLSYSTYLGGRLSDAGFGVAVAADGSNAYLTGVVSSPDFPVTLNGSQRQIGSDFNSDAFVAEISFGAASRMPTIAAGGVVNGTSFGAGPIAPGSILSIFGVNLSGSIANATNLPLPVNLSDVSVTINGISAPLYYVAPGQINAQMPFEIAPGLASIQVRTAAGASAAVPITITNTAPYLSTTGNGRSVAQNQDGSLNSPGNPAKAGSIIVAYFTGIGPVDATVLNGAPSPFAISAQQSSAAIGSVSAAIQYIGLTPESVGLAQANIKIPVTLGTGDYPLVIDIGGTQSNSALIAVTR